MPLAIIMPDPRPRIFRFLFKTIFLLVCACASDTTLRPETAADLIREGRKLEHDKRFIKAKGKYQQVLEDFPDSKERLAAQLYMADALYRSKSYEEAKFNYQKFIELYPVHSKIDHAYFYRAMSDFKLIDLAARDQTATHSSLESFEDFIKRFPKSPFLKRAKIKKQECIEKIAQNIFIIGKYYFKSGSYQSAIRRLNNLLEKHPNRKLNDEAIFLLAESYYKEQNFNKAKASYRHLLSQFPHSKFASKSRKRLKKVNRLVPRSVKAN